MVKFFYPAGAATWLLTEMDPGDNDVLWGLCDLGHGCPELGPVRLSEVEAFRGRLGVGIERDAHWQGRHPVSVYQAVASAEGRIVDRPTEDQVAAATAGGGPRP